MNDIEADSRHLDVRSEVLSVGHEPMGLMIGHRILQIASTRWLTIWCRRRIRFFDRSI